MDAQEIFNTVATHLFKQGKRAFHPKLGICAYRGAGKTKCAVGCLIPDNLYEQSMEGADAVYLLDRYDSLSELQPHKYLLEALQGAHDDETNWESTSKMCGELRFKGRTFGLDVSIIDTLSFQGR